MINKFTFLTTAFLFSFFQMFAQTIISGVVNNKSTNENIDAASIIIKGGTSGTYSDAKGKFKLVTTQKPPFTIVISSVGFTGIELQVTNESEKITASLEPSYALGQDVVVAASRVPERILESPVSIERVNSLAIANAPTTSYYNTLLNLKGVDFTTSSLTFQTPSTRGFNGSGNVRLNQIIDGMDNQAPGLNFSVGSVNGPTDIDVDNMELLEGASSALYGPGGMNGTLLVTSKDPFKYQGVSFQVKEGVMNINSPAKKASPFQDYAFRWAEKLGDKFAFKISAQLVNAQDWVAYDSSDYDATTGQKISGTRSTDPNYNGVNIYGDEISENLNTLNQQILGTIEKQIGAPTYSALYAGSKYFLDVLNPNATLQQYNDFLNKNNGQALVQGKASPFLYGDIRNYFTNASASITGYKEQNVVEPITRNIRISGELAYKLSDQTTLSLAGNYGTGNTVYTGSDRYVLKNLQIGQYKVELKSKNWFIRGYTTQENSGDAYNATVNTDILNYKVYGSSWYSTYIGNYVGAFSATQNTAIAQNIARQQADLVLPAPGSALYKHVADSIAKLAIPNGGHFLDRTDLYVAEAQYNLTNVLGLKKGTDVLVGGDFKQYELNSQGTLFADTAGKIGISEYGIYGQVSQEFFKNVLKLSVSGRYDKNQNFDGKFTPRASAVITVAKNQNIRLSYQQAYRFPTTQNQWINLTVGGNEFLIGGLPQLRDFYNLNPGDLKYNPGFTLASVLAGNPQIATFGKYTPETANSYEAGYKGLIANNKLLIDIYGYFSQYKDLLTRETVLQSIDGNPADLLQGYRGISVSVNYTGKITTSGYGASLQYLLRHNFYITANFSSDNINHRDSVYSPQATFKSYYNTPRYRSNAGIGNSGFGPQKKFGFNLIWHWQDKFYTQADFIDGYVNAYSSLDAEVSYKFSKIKSLIKLGATNFTNHYYLNAPGNPYVGGLYYISFGYNVF